MTKFNGFSSKHVHVR